MTKHTDFNNVNSGQHAENSVLTIIADTIGSNPNDVETCIKELINTQNTNDYGWETAFHMQDSLGAYVALNTTVDHEDDRAVLQTSFLGMSIDEINDSSTLDKIDSFCRYMASTNKPEPSEITVQHLAR